MRQGVKIMSLLGGAARSDPAQSVGNIAGGLGSTMGADCSCSRSPLIVELSDNQK